MEKWPPGTNRNHSEGMNSAIPTTTQGRRRPNGVRSRSETEATVMSATTSKMRPKVIATPSSARGRPNTWL